MKESTGAVGSIYIVMFFIMIIFGFIISILSYYKSYKVNNTITSIIEDYGGYNSVSKKAIDKKLEAYGYNIGKKVKCKKSATDTNKKFFSANATSTVEDNEVESNGYCVSIVDENNELGGTYTYYSYEVSTYLILNFGIFDFKFPYKISSKTTTMYGCFGKMNCT